MALVLKDRVKQTTTTTGTGSIVLNGTVDGFQTFAAALTDGDTTYYSIFEPSTNEWEVGLGTWTEGTTTLARTTVLASSNSGSAVSLTAQAEVFISQPAGKAAFFNADGDLDLSRDPQTALQAATKQYVDTIAAAGIHYHTPVRVETPSALTATYDNGTAGVGATLTNSGTQAALSIDGVTLSTSDRVLVYNQSNAAHNGIYTVTNTGSASTNWVLTRATDADSYGASDPDSLGEGDAFFVSEGATGAGELYVMNTSGTITFGTTNITFTVIAETAVYAAGDGLTLTGTTFAVGAGTGVTVNANDVAIGQDVGTTADVTFNTVTADLTGDVTGNVTGAVTGNASTATALQTARNIGGVSFDGTASINLPGVNTTGNQDTTGNAATATAWETGRTISLTGDVTGSVTGVDGSGNASIATTIAANSVALGTDTTGNYVTSVASGSYITGGAAGSEGAALTIGVDATPNNTASKVVARDASGNFSAGTITAALSGNASTASTLATARNIAVTGAVTGNANFDGSGNISIATTATSDPTLTLAGDASGSATFTNLGNATLTVTVADDSHNHVISNVDGLQTALDGKLSTSGKAADSNLLDGIDSSAFLRSNADDTFTGNIETTSTNGIRFGSANQTDGNDGFIAAGKFASGLNIVGTQTTAGTGRQVRIWGNVITDGGNTYWHAGNDGAGSGLDADTLDGVQGSSYLRSDTSDTFTGTLTLNGTLVMGANVINDVEDIYLRDKLFHDGDTDTYLGFATNQINLVTGNSTSAAFNGNGAFLTDGSLHEDYDALSGTSPTCNVNSGGAFSLTMTGNTTFTFSGGTSGYSEGFVLQLTGNGGTVTWPSSVKWAGGTAPDAPASGETDILVFHTRDGGTNWYGVLASDAAA